VPETRVERGVFVLGVLAIAALGFLVAHLWHHTHGVAAAPGTTSLSTRANNVVRYGDRSYEDRSYNHDRLTDEERSHEGLGELDRFERCSLR